MLTLSDKCISEKCKGLENQCDLIEGSKWSQWSSLKKVKFNVTKNNLV
jgi:hypothetical protein